MIADVCVCDRRCDAELAVAGRPNDACVAALESALLRGWGAWPAGPQAPPPVELLAGGAEVALLQLPV